jgi:chorismate dehydratase
MFIFVALQAAPVKISIVNYSNTLPFKWALRNSPILKEIDLQEDIPSICAQKLKFNQVDLALVPVALIPELTSYNIESRFCIGADGAVDSVKLYSEVPLQNIKKVVLDYQSRSSITLTRVLFKNFWKKEVEFIDAGPGFEENISGNSAAVVIGDRTFALNGRFSHEFDLAAEWKKFTGLPFVFAAWVSVQKLDADFMKRFDETLAYGLAHIEQAVDSSPIHSSITRPKILDYLHNKIDYGFDENKKKALQLFLQYIRDL